MADYTEFSGSARRTPALALDFTGLLPALLGLLLVWLIGTPTYGVDAHFYLDAAEILRTEGLLSESHKLAHYPPLFPLTIALLGGNLALLQLMKACLLAANLVLFSLLLRLAGLRLWLVVGGVLMLAFSPAILEQHAILTTEPLFLLLVQLMLIALVSDQWKWVLLFVAIAPLQRYAGVTLIGVTMLWWLLQREYHKAMVFGLVSGMPIGLWMLRNSLIGENAGREIIFHPISSAHVLLGGYTLASWFLPMVLVLGVLYILGRRDGSLVPRPRPRPDVVRACWLWIGVYLSFLVFSISFFDFATPLDERILLPVLIAGWVIIAHQAERMLRAARRDLPHVISYVVCLLLVAHIGAGAISARTITNEGIGLETHVQSVYYPAYNAMLAELPPGTPVYSNQNNILRTMGYDGVELLPRRLNLVTRQAIPEHDTRMAALAAAIPVGETAVVWFSDVQSPEHITLGELRAMLNMNGKRTGNMVLFYAEQD